MNFTRRRGAIAFFIALGAILIGVTITLNIGWIILTANERRLATLVIGIVFFAVLIAGVVLNTVFLLREIRRNERQDSFLNAVTHELKTPIASIRLYLETLQHRPVDEAQRQEFYNIMLADSDRLLASVEQVLKAGQLGQKQRQLNRALVDIEDLLVECIGITIQRHHLSPESIVVERLPAGVYQRVLGLAEDLRTAFLNVLDNAVKYSTDPVRIRCCFGMDRHSFASIQITDNGVGLPPGHQRRIFKRFYRVPGRTMARIKGTGLGLFLVRAIMRQHGGDATAHSPGLAQGTTITLTLPLAAPAADRQPEPP